MLEIKPNSPELAAEIDEKATSINGTDAKIVFKNGSMIKVVTSSDTSRGNRANLLIIDEFRMVKKEVIDTILRKFLASPRHPKYLDKSEYKKDKSLIEHNSTMYLSSAYYKDHWSYTRAKDSCRFMLDESKHNFVCGFPYHLGIEEGILIEEDVAEQMMESDFNEVTWSMEMMAEFWGDANGSFFGFDMVSKNRKIEFPMLPESVSAKIPSATKMRIPPKQPGEKRILSADIALMATGKHKNDATAIFINQLMPTKAARYMSNIVYSENSEGLHTEDQALRLRKLYEEYACDYIVLDARGVGLGVYDTLARELTDPETGETYPPLSCCNNSELAARCENPNAKKAIWAILGSAKLNSDCALLLREGFRAGRIRLLNTEYDAEESLGELRGFNSLSTEDRMKIMAPYIDTTLLVNELINLKHDESSGLVKLSERTGMRKDRYSSLSYNYYVATMLEREVRRGTVRDAENIDDTFIFRAPKQKITERR